MQMAIPNMHRSYKTPSSYHGMIVAEVMGDPCMGVDGTEHLSVFRQPVLIFEGDKGKMAKACTCTPSARPYDLTWFATQTQDGGS